MLVAPQPSIKIDRRPSGLTISIAIDGLGAIGAGGDLPSDMSPSPMRLRHDGGDHGAKDGFSRPIGTIARSPESIDGLIEQWKAYMTRKGRAKNTVINYVPNVKRMATECGWACIDDLTVQSVEYWHERVGAEWKSTSFNRYVAAARSFGEWLWKVQRVSESPFARLEYASKAGEQGSRAASTDEARAWLLDSAAMQGAGRITSGNPTLVAKMELLAGMRGGDVARLAWAMLELDAPIPHVAWDARANKGKRSGLVALAPELVSDLKAHRDAMRLLAADKGLLCKAVKARRRVEKPIDPDDAKSLVFAEIPTDRRFHKVRERAGIQQFDKLGRPYTPHSFRKWFKTTLVGLGCPAELSEYMELRKGGTKERYIDPGLEIQAEWLAKLPRLGASEAEHKARASGYERHNSGYVVPWAVVADRLQNPVGHGVNATNANTNAHNTPHGLSNAAIGIIFDEIGEAMKRIAARMGGGA